MKWDEVYLVLLFGGLALALLVVDRIFRIQPFMERQGFQSGGSASIQRCGVTMPPCPHPLRCMNGLCRSEEEPVVREKNPLPVVP